MTDGAAAAALGELFRARWRAAVGELPAPRHGGRRRPGRTGLRRTSTAATSAIARTEPAWRDSAERRARSAALTLEAIAAARELIYLENQYFTWPLAVEALAVAAGRAVGPEIVLVCSGQSPSYFDRLTMDRARSTALWRLKIQRRVRPLPRVRALRRRRRARSSPTPR